MAKPCLCSALQGGTEPKDLRGFPENKAAAGSQHCLRRGGRHSPPAPAKEKSPGEAESLCLISLVTPAPSQLRLWKGERQRHPSKGQPSWNALLREMQSLGQPVSMV